MKKLSHLVLLALVVSCSGSGDGGNTGGSGFDIAIGNEKEISSFSVGASVFESDNSSIPAAGDGQTIRVTSEFEAVDKYRKGLINSKGRCSGREVIDFTKTIESSSDSMIKVNTSESQLISEIKEDKCDSTPTQRTSYYASHEQSVNSTAVISVLQQLAIINFNPANIFVTKRSRGSYEGKDVEKVNFELQNVYEWETVEQEDNVFCSLIFDVNAPTHLSFIYGKCLFSGMTNYYQDDGSIYKSSYAYNLTLKAVDNYFYQPAPLPPEPKPEPIVEEDPEPETRPKLEKVEVIETKPIVKTKIKIEAPILTEKVKVKKPEIEEIPESSGE